MWQGFFQTVPENGFKTHKCHITKKTHQIKTHVTCISENVIYRITCKKPQCKDFVYIGQTKRRFCDRFAEHRGYVSQNKIGQVCGEHFTTLKQQQKQNKIVENINAKKKSGNQHNPDDP